MFSVIINQSLGILVTSVIGTLLREFGYLKDFDFQCGSTSFSVSASIPSPANPVGPFNALTHAKHPVFILAL